MADDPSPKPRPPLRAGRWSSPRSSPLATNRLMFRLIGIPALAFAGVLIYRGLHERLTLPECDSSRAKQTLDGVLKEMKVEPLRDEPIKTIASSKDKVDCNVVLPLADGGSLNIDYSFYWQDNTADMRYSISRRPARSTSFPPKGDNPLP
jgi:hypothetical protein